MGVESKDGNLNLKVGLGKSVTFQRGDRVDSLAVMLERLTNVEGLTKDIGDVNARISGVEANTAAQDRALSGLISTNAAKISDNTVAISSVRQSVVNLVGPSGQVNVNKVNIEDLQGRVSSIVASSGPIAVEASRALSAENSLGAVIGGLSTRVNGVDTVASSAATKASALQVQLGSEVTRATSAENSVAASVATVSGRVTTVETAASSTATRLGNVDSAQQSTASRVGIVDGAQQSTAARVVTLQTGLDNEVTRAINQDTSLGTVWDAGWCCLWVCLFVMGY
jgi:hypothetical protein